MQKLGYLVLSLAVSTAGCSIAFVQGPSVVAGKVECTRELTLPMVDAAVGVVGIATPFILEATRDRSQNVNWPLTIGLWTTGAVAAVSALIGVQKVKRCRRTAPPPGIALAPS